MDNFSDIRISLPPGTKLKGFRGTYTVQNMICLSERSLTVASVDESGRKWRLKLYNGEAAVTEKAQRMLYSVSTKGILLPYDIGQFSGMPFAVTQEIKEKSLEKNPISANLIAERIIPQMAYVMEQYHKKGILLRDICPEHILYHQQEQTIAYCGFNNMTVLSGKAIATKAAGYGQHFSFIAPEVDKYGYSIYSDYFSLGVTLLTLINGYNPMQNLSRDTYVKMLFSGKIPGIDIQHLKLTPYEYYSTEDKILYLALGLMQPEPKNRWCYGEIRCWCNNQRLPLIQKGERVYYQFDMPFTIEKTSCWNMKQIAENLAEKKAAWNEETVGQLIVYMKKYRMPCTAMLESYKKDNSLSPKGKIFRCIYTLNPAMDGLWWDGKGYKDSETLIQAVADKKISQGVLSQILMDRCFSFLEEKRRSLGKYHTNQSVDLREMEQTEQINPGVGAQRCLMIFVQNIKKRAFYVQGKQYGSLTELLKAHQRNGKALRENSRQILSEQSFQAWLWANGMEAAGKEAVRLSKQDKEQSFFLLLSLCESYEQSVDIKKMARELYLQWGDYAPIVWLSRNIKGYRVSSPTHQILYDVFAMSQFDLGQSLEQLSAKAQSLVLDYQTFVSRTLDSPISLENGTADAYSYGYYPLSAEYYFYSRWREGLEVCPAFLKSVGETPTKEELQSWLKI